MIGWWRRGTGWWTLYCSDLIKVHWEYSESFARATKTELHLEAVHTSGTHLAYPGAQQTDADLAVVVEVGIEAAAALGQVSKQRRHSWVDVRQLDVKQEHTVLVGRASRPFDQSREQVLWWSNKRKVQHVWCCNLKEANVQGEASAGEYVWDNRTKYSAADVRVKTGCFYLSSPVIFKVFILLLILLNLMMAFEFEKGPLVIMRLLRTSNFILWCQNDFFLTLLSTLT